MIGRLYRWMGKQIHSPHAERILGFLFYLEAIFFIPTDPMLIFYCIEQRKKGFRYATIATVSSVLGGVTGYYIGYWLWSTNGHEIIHNPLLNRIITPSMFEYLQEQYQRYEYWAILTAGFTPVPYKAATLTAGFCRLSLIPFVVCSLISRGARFFLFAFLIKRLGAGMKKRVGLYVSLVSILTVLVLFLTGWWFKEYTL